MPETNYVPSINECWDMWEAELAYQHDYDIFEMGLSREEEEAYTNKDLAWDLATKQVYRFKRLPAELFLNKESAMSDMIAMNEALDEEYDRYENRVQDELEMGFPEQFKPLDELLEIYTIKELMQPVKEGEETPYWKQCVDNIDGLLQNSRKD